MSRHLTRLIELKSAVEHKQHAMKKADLIEILSMLFDYCISIEEGNVLADNAMIEVLENLKSELEDVREKEKESITLSKGEKACIMDWFNGWAVTYHKNDEGEFNVPQNHKKLAKRLLHEGEMLKNENISVKT